MSSGSSRQRSKPAGGAPDAHARPARKNTVAGEVEVRNALMVGDRVAARYVLHTTMRTGHRVSHEVYMFCELAPDGRLRRIHSTTRDVSEQE